MKIDNYPYVLRPVYTNTYVYVNIVYEYMP